MSTDWKSLVNKTINKSPNQCPTEIFIDGLKYFEDLSNEIKRVSNAKGNRFIYIMGWMLDISFKLSPTGKDTLESLLRTADFKGVEIRVLIWNNFIPSYYKKNHEAIKSINSFPKNSFGLIDSHTYTSAESDTILNSIKLRAYPIFKFIEKQNLEKSFKFLKDGMPLKELFQISSVGAHHDKVIIIKSEEGLKAYCGGMDINQNRISEQHDIQCRVENIPASELLDRFLKRWESLERSRFKDKLQGFSLSGRNYKINSSFNKIAHPYVSAIGTYNTPIWNTTEKKLRKDRSAEKMIIASIKNAKKFVYIEDQYMISISIAKALHDALNNGLKQLIILTQPSILSKTDIMLPNRKREEFIDIVLYGKIIKKQKYTRRNKPASPHFKKVDIYQSAISENKNWHKIIHSKLYIIDDEIAIIGSFNCSERSLKHDSESGVIIIENEKNKNPFISRFRKTLWAHHLGPTVWLYKLKIRNMFNPYKWDALTPVIQSYAASGQDVDRDIVLYSFEAYRKSKSKESIVLSSLFDIGTKNNTRGFIEDEIVAINKLANSDEFVRLIWSIVEPS